MCPPKKTAISTIEMPYGSSRDPKDNTMKTKFQCLSDAFFAVRGLATHLPLFFPPTV